MSTDDEFERLVAGLSPAVPARPHQLALVLTPVASAAALAGLCAMSGVHCTVLPSSTGAVAAIELEEDPFAGLVPGAPPEADALARTLSRLTHVEVLLLVARLGADREGDVSGQLSAHRYTGGEHVGDIAPGVVLAAVDGIVEDLVLGQTALADVPGAEDTAGIPRWKAARMYTRGLRKRKP